ncbi:MAG: TonB-dependent receptor [Bacteroidetes bacterium GWF2_38_335]|nr:MAG: TonB-dependent receptor [Bacteroidetes bacterium GWF2_38_335]OFY79448.1 MAG: TonB-dependent receptor [Bacteroidetes bacterium RIFOXYA12_FULL_38_20]
MKHYIVAFFLLVLFAPGFLAAQKFTISGYVKDVQTGEDLIGASVYIKSISKGTTTNNYGFYSLTIDKGTYDLTVSFLGYSDFTKKIDLKQNVKLNVELNSSSIITETVVVTGERSDRNVKSTQMSIVKMPVEQIKTLPALMGEVDILKTIQLLPGVKSGGEGNTGFYVRGGGPDQNLIMLDEAVVYNASHLFGFFSVFNADAVKSVNLIKGGMPAQYGGRLSSVLDLSMKDGNSKEFEVDGGIGIISSRLTVQGPIKKDTCSFIVSARRTYIDVLVEPFVKKTAKARGSGYYFYDLNTKINYRFSDKDRLFLSGYFGRDVFTFKRKDLGFDVSIPWGNATASLRWNHLFNDKLFVNTTAVFSDYQFSFGAEQDLFEFKLFSGITDYNLKVDFTYLPNVLHNIKFGANYTYHIFRPSSVSARIGKTEYDLTGIIKYFAHDAAIYINDDFDLTEKLGLSLGARATYFEQVGPFDRFIKNQYGITTDTIHYQAGEKIVDYKNIEPRASLRYSLNSKSSIKASYTQNYQYIHLATISSVSLPTDLWVPSSELVEPQFGTQYAMGYFRNFKKDMYETSLEVYYKDLRNQIAYKDGALPGDDIGENADNSFTFGNGWSYGVELFLKKRLGKTTGWIGYTWSKTMRKYEDINNGEPFPEKYDRRHDISFIMTHEFNKNWSASVIWVYSTGNASTLAIGRYMIDGRIVNEYGPRNSYRMDPYHRGDISVTWKPENKKNRKVEESWNFGVYNVYCRYNPYFIYFFNEGNFYEGNLQTKAYQVSLFPIMPSISWNFKF